MTKHFFKKVAIMKALEERVVVVTPAVLGDAGTEVEPAVCAYKDPNQSDQSLAKEFDVSINIVRDMRRAAFGVIQRGTAAPETRIAELEKVVGEIQAQNAGFERRLAVIERALSA